MLSVVVIKWLKIKISPNDSVKDLTMCPAIQGFVLSVPNSDRTWTLPPLNSDTNLITPRCLLIPFCGLRTFCPDNPVTLYVSTQCTQRNFLVIVIILIFLHVWFMETDFYPTPSCFLIWKLEQGRRQRQRQRQKTMI